MFKRILVLGLLVLMSAQTFAAEFSDVESGDQNAEAIYRLRDAHILQGYEDGSFRPHNSLNRAELMKIVVRAGGYTPMGDDLKNCFKDVRDEWFAPYVCFGKERGWISGYSDGYFRPEQEVNKAEAMKMLLEVFGVSTPKVYVDPFVDVDAEAWFGKYVGAAKTMLLLEEQTQYQPANNMTRAGFAENLNRLIDNESERFVAAAIEMCGSTGNDPIDSSYEEEFEEALGNHGFAVYSDPKLFSPLKYRYITFIETSDGSSFCESLGEAEELVKVSVLPKTSHSFGLGNEFTEGEYFFGGDILTLNVGYSGCGVSDFTLFWNGGTWREAKLGLVRNYGKPVPDVECEMYINQTLKFDLSPIKEAYWDDFNPTSAGDVLIGEPLDFLKIEVYTGANQTKAFSFDYKMF